VSPDPCRGNQELTNAPRLRPALRHPAGRPRWPQPNTKKAARRLKTGWPTGLCGLHRSRPPPSTAKRLPPPPESPRNPPGIIPGIIPGMAPVPGLADPRKSRPSPPRNAPGMPPECPAPGSTEMPRIDPELPRCPGRPGHPASPASPGHSPARARKHGAAMVRGDYAPCPYTPVPPLWHPSRKRDRKTPECPAYDGLQPAFPGFALSIGLYIHAIPATIPP